MVVAPAEVRAVHLDRAARAVDLGEHGEPFLALVVARVARRRAGARAPRGRGSASATRPRSRRRRRRVRGSTRTRRGRGRARPRARGPGCARRPPRPPAAPRCRRRPRACSPRSGACVRPTARSDPRGSRSRCGPGVSTSGPYPGSQRRRSPGDLGARSRCAAYRPGVIRRLFKNLGVLDPTDAPDESAQLERDGYAHLRGVLDAGRGRATARRDRRGVRGDPRPSACAPTRTSSATRCTTAAPRARPR